MLGVSLFLAWVELSAQQTRTEFAVVQKLRDNGLEVRALYRHQFRENTFSKYDIRAKSPGSWFARKLWGDQAFVRIEKLIVKGDIDRVECMELHRIKGLRGLALNSPCLTDLSSLFEIKDLKSLTIENSPLIRSGNIECLFRIASLEKLTIIDCENITELDSLATSEIKHLMIINCGIDEFDGSLFPCLERIALFENGKLQTVKCIELSSGLSSLEIERCSEIAFIEIACARKLKGVRISSCSQLKTIVLKDVPSLSDFEVDECIALNTVVGLDDLSPHQTHVSDCPNLETLAGRLRD